jgi:hypothetical protein
MSKQQGEPRKHAQVRAQAEKLVETTGIPRNLAFQVAMGNLSLNDVLQKLAFRDEIDKIIRRYEFPRSLATQIAMGQVELEDVLRKRRLLEYTESSRDKSMLTEVEASGDQVTFLLHGMQRKSGVVSNVTAYDFTLTPKQGPPEVIHKLQARAGWGARKNAAVLSCLKKDKEHAVAVEPIVKPQDRFHCSNRRLFQHMEAADKLSIHLLEGDIVIGTIDWIGRWEVGIKIKKGPVVTVFRHAMAALEGA